MKDRIYSFESIRNFRDFGGYDTKGGGRVAEGLLLRSAHFAEATEADIARLDALNCAMVVDLRRPDERKSQPNRWPGQKAREVFSELGEAGEAPHVAFLRQASVDAATAETFMHKLYEEIPYDPRYIELFSAFLKGAAEGQGASLVHCAAGKDRTGIICALTLIALDVPEDVVFADYELTNSAVQVDVRMPEVQKAVEAYLQRPIPLEAVRPFIGVRAAYLSGAFAAINARSGSLEAYLENALGVDENIRQALRDKHVR